MILRARSRLTFPSIRAMVAILSGCSRNREPFFDLLNSRGLSTPDCSQGMRFGVLLVPALR